jgi:hypothetical protein
LLDEKTAPAEPIGLVLTGPSSRTSRGNTSMKNILLFIMLVDLISPLYASEIAYSNIENELLTMGIEDQSIRASNADVTKIIEVDRKNTERLKQIVSKIGWPTKAMVGKKGASAAWHIVQRADHDPSFQKYALEMIEPLVNDGKLPSSYYTFLYDRTHKPQKYGTQGGCKGTKWIPRDIEQPDLLIERRSVYNMMPYSDYKKIMNNICIGIFPES